MGNYFEPVLSEEQLAAYLDGILSTSESNMVEGLISSDPEMQEIQDAIDSVDYTFLYDIDEEVPIECVADDFTLPDVELDYNDAEDAFVESRYEGEIEYDEQEDFPSEPDEVNDYHNDSPDYSTDDSYCDNNDFDDISF